MKIILISGKAESGKNTFADLLEKHIKINNQSVLQIAYGDDVKHICKQYFAWDGNKDEMGRFILQTVGTNRVRENLNRPNFWVDRVCDIITITEGMFDYILVPDARFINEIEIPKSRFSNVISVRVNRPNHISKLTKEQLLHPSETALDNYEFDWVIENTSLIKLENKAIELLKKL